MDIFFSGFGAFLAFALVVIISRLNEMRDIAQESNSELKELNAHLKYLKRKFNEANQ